VIVKSWENNGTKIQMTEWLKTYNIMKLTGNNTSLIESGFSYNEAEMVFNFLIDVEQGIKNEFGEF